MKSGLERSAAEDNPAIALHVSYQICIRDRFALVDLPEACRHAVFVECLIRAEGPHPVTGRLQDRAANLSQTEPENEIKFVRADSPDVRFLEAQHELPVRLCATDHRRNSTETIRQIDGSKGLRSEEPSIHPKKETLSRDSTQIVDARGANMGQNQQRQFNGGIPKQFLE